MSNSSSIQGAVKISWNNIGFVYEHVTEKLGVWFVYIYRNAFVIYIDKHNSKFLTKVNTDPIYQPLHSGRIGHKVNF